MEWGLGREITRERERKGGSRKETTRKVDRVRDGLERRTEIDKRQQRRDR